MTRPRAWPASTPPTAPSRPRPARGRLGGPHDAGGWHLAQVNIALPREPLDAPLLADFVAALAPVNAVADASPGFVWRLQTEDGDATAIRAFGDDRLIVNMSVWESVEALRGFVYGEAHAAVIRRRGSRRVRDIGAPPVGDGRCRPLRRPGAGAPRRVGQAEATGAPPRTGRARPRC